jgi:hypothetical protein
MVCWGWVGPGGTGNLLVRQLRRLGLGQQYAGAVQHVSRSVVVAASALGPCVQLNQAVAVGEDRCVAT